MKPNGVAGAILAALQEDPETIAIASAAQGELSRGEALSRSLSIAGMLRRHGLRQGDTVVICLRDGLTAVLTIFAAWWCGAAPLVMDFRSKGRDRAEAARAIGARWVLETRNPPDGEPYESLIWSDDWLSARPLGVSDITLADIEAPALFGASSGTTGHPRIYEFSHQTYLRRAHVSTLGSRAGDRVLMPLSLAYSAARNLVLGTLLRRAKLYIDPPLFSASELADRILSSRVDVCRLTPTAVRALIDEVGPRESPLFRDLRLLDSAGGPPGPSDKVEAYRRLSHGYATRYSTSLTGQVTELTGPDVLARPDSEGRLIEGVRIVTLDPETLEPLQAGETGLLRIEAPSVADRMFQTGESRSRERCGPGWGVPGDIGRLDADGFITISGREADMIVRGGVSVMPDEIETLLRGLAGIKDAGVVGVPDKSLGQEIAAFLVTDGRPLEQIHSELMARFQPDRRPRLVQVVDALPYNTNGKLTRAALVQSLESDFPHLDKIPEG